MSIPTSVTTIGNNAFFMCDSLTNVSIPNGVASIGNSVFHSCKRLTSIDVTSGNSNYSSVDGVLFNKAQTVLIQYPAEKCAISYSIPNSVTNIGDEAFSGCKSLKRVDIPNSVVNIGDEAFSRCKSLRSIAIPNSVASIGSSAFKECKSLLNIIIPDSVTEIYADTFSKCSSLKNITIPNSVEDIADSAFEYCISLSSIAIPEGITSIEARVFQGCKSLKNIVIPKSITSIGEKSFWGCTSLKSVTLPEGVVSIGDEAFWGCTSLGNAAIPDSVTSIGYRAFRKTPVELAIPERIPVDEVREQETEAEEEVEEIKPELLLPKCHEKPRAYICCAKWDVEHVRTLVAELYWEGFNFYYNAKNTVEQEIDSSQCVLVFFSNKTEKSNQVMNKLKYAVQHDPSHIIQVFLGDCTDWPDEVRDKLHDRQAIIQSLCSEQEFSGRIRDSLRTFECNIGHPRGFDVQKKDNAVEIVRFSPTDFPLLVIPKTFFDPPLPLTSIGATAFKECEILTDITIPYGVTNIGEGTIGSGAFMGCKSLRNVNIPDSMLSIGAYAFSGCEKLESIIIPESVTSIGDYAFSFCNSLKNIVIPNSINKISNEVFSWCESLTNIDLPQDIKSIGDSAFSLCKSLTSIDIPEGVKSIGKSAFSSCESLKNIIIPGNVEEIGNSAFNNCTSLKAIVIPDTVKKFGKNAPGFLIFLRKAIGLLRGTKTTMLEDYSDVFENCRLLTIYTPVGSTAWKYATEYNIKHGDYKQAIEYFKKDIEIYQQESPKDTKGLLELLDVLKNLQIKVYGEENEAVAATYNKIGSVYFKAGNGNLALEYASKSLTLRKKVLGEEHADTAMSYFNTAEVYKALKDNNMALEYYKKAQQMFKANKPKDYKALLKVTNKILELQKQIHIEENADIAEAYSDIGSFYYGLKEYDKSLKNAIHALEIQKKLFGENHIEVAKALVDTGIVYYKMGNYAESLKALNSALEAAQRNNSLKQLNVTFIRDLISKMTTQSPESMIGIDSK
jgi:tetratricopeptide (TPR) repeat protein